jgi:formylglycine-generating enzyme required for sulfatase activity
VTIPERLAVGRFAVTFEEWEHYAAAAGKPVPNDKKWGRGRRPVINVSWDDAQGYAAWLSEKTGSVYQLLSEAEWEYCCRAGTETAYSFGDTITTEQAKFSSRGSGNTRGTVEVGTYPANAWGLHDMHGNVWEWCEDAYVDTYEGALDNGAARDAKGKSSLRVLRGGSWDNRPRYLRTADRDGYLPDSRIGSIGFRLARTLNP